jgi:oxidoreductase
MSSAHSALVIGATGAVGKNVLKELLSSTYFTKVGEYGRRVTPLDSITTGKEKLEQKVIDFEKVDDAGLKDGKWDVVFITLGTTMANAGSAAGFEKIDREYVVNSARAAKSDSSTQRLIYVSSAGANPTSRFLYTRSKGLTEVGLADLGYSDTIVFRPGFLTKAGRAKASVSENIVGHLASFASHFSPSIEIPVSLLGKSIVQAGRLGSAALPPVAEGYKASGSTPFTVIGNKGAVALGNAAV